MFKENFSLITRTRYNVYNTIGGTCFFVEFCDVQAGLWGRGCGFNNDGITTCDANRRHPAHWDHGGEVEGCDTGKYTGKELILLLCGGDKTTQQVDIKNANKITKRYEGDETMKTKIKEIVAFADWDPTEYIETKEGVIAFFDGILEKNDPELFFKIIGYINRSKGMAKITRELKLNREGLYTTYLRRGTRPLLP
jgi:probable addiction module antidote protein